MAKEAAASPLNQVSGNQQQVLLQAQQLIAGLGLGFSGASFPSADLMQMQQQSWAQQAWLQQMQAAGGVQLPSPNFGSLPALGSGGGSGSGQGPSAPILELDLKPKRGPCELCGGAHDMIKDCTKFREVFKQAKGPPRVHRG